MFYFQSMFLQVYNGITGSTTLTAVQAIAWSILLVSVLFAIYEAYARGGDTRALALAGVRYLMLGLIISQYPNVFLKVNNGFNAVAQQISPTDVLTDYRAQVQAYLSSMSGASAWYNAIPGGLAGFLSIFVQTIAVIVFPITYALFSFFYSLYGAILYVCGPLVLALYPAFGIGTLARTYMVNLLIWNAWGILYAIMSQLLTIMNANTLTGVLTAQNFGGLFQNASEMLLISLSSIMLSIMVALIPFIAKRVVSGDVGSTLFTVIGSAAAALQAVAVASAGMSMGGGGGDHGGGGGGGGGNGGGGGGGGGTGGGRTGPDASSNRAPRPPQDRGNSGGNGNAGDGNDGTDRSPRAPAEGPTNADAQGTTSDNTGSGGDTPTGQGRDGSPAPQRRHGSDGGGRLRSPHVSGLYYAPYAAGWAAGRTVRALRSIGGRQENT